MIVKKEWCNFYGSIHGGAIGTIIDCATTLAILKEDKNERYKYIFRQHVSVDLTVNFINTANKDDEILIISEVNKVGKNLAFSNAKILNLANNKIIATGSHTKAFLN